jgi:hypothetical protein
MKKAAVQRQSPPLNLTTPSNVKLTADVANISQETLHLVSGKDLVVRTLIGKAFVKINSLRLTQD